MSEQPPYQEMPMNTRGVWFAYNPDWSTFRVFRDELQALRYAVKNSLQVVMVPFGKDPRDVAADPNPPRPPATRGSRGEPQG